MKKISFNQIAVFFFLFTAIVSLGLFTGISLLTYFPLGDYRGILTLLSVVASIYFYAILVYRVFFMFFPLQEGLLELGSRAEFAAQVNILFYLFFFKSLICSSIIPLPVMRVVYQALGARLGKNTYSAGTLLDPMLTELGDNCIVGHNAALFSHAIEGKCFALSRIKIGHGVTIGAMSVVMSGVHIGDGAIVSAGSVVTKNTQIGKDEVWGGVPAKCLKRPSAVMTSSRVSLFQKKSA